MKTIVVASRKGGAGKTTTVRHLSTMFSLAGKKVLIADTDPLGTLTQWFDRRSQAMGKSDTLQLLKVPYKQLAEAKEYAAKAQFDILMIDTPPESNEAIEDTAKLGDFIIIPSKPTPDDIEAVPRTVNLVKKLNIPYIFVLNEAKKGTQLLTMALEILSQLGPIAPTQYSHVAVPTAVIRGKIVAETRPEHSSAEDIERLFEFVRSQIGDM